MPFLEQKMRRQKAAATRRLNTSGRRAKGRPIPGNPPNDRMRRGPDCNRPKRVCADASPPTRSPQSIPMAIRMRFLRHRGIYPSDMGFTDQPRPGLEPCLPPMAPNPGPRTRREDRALLIVQMSSGRLFLDRVARQHCPSPLHRHAQHKAIAGSKGTIYHRTVTSVLTGCLTSGGKRMWALNTMAKMGGETIAASISYDWFPGYELFKRHYIGPGDTWWGADMAVVPLGKGRCMVSQLRLLENLGKDPVADKILYNLIRYVTKGD